MNVLRFVSPITALLAAAVGTLIFVLPVAALITTADAFFKGLLTRRQASNNDTPKVDLTEIRSSKPASHGVPDYVSPIIAYRAWQWDGSRLKSLNGESWHPGQPLAAECRRRARHRPPHENCHCGIYAAKSLEQLLRMGYSHQSDGLYGEVYLWGTVVEHRLGWRAQFAYPKSLMLPSKMLLFSAKDVVSLLSALGAYQVDVFVSTRGKKVRLWTRQGSIDLEGLASVFRFGSA